MLCTKFDKEKNEWNGPNTDPMYNPKSSLGNLILNALQTNGPRIAQICTKTNAITTFHELYDQTICVAQNLRKIGCQKGEVILFLTKTPSDISAIIFAALCLGCPVTGLAAYNTKLEHLHHLKITQPKYVFCDLEYFDQLKECFETLNYEPKFFTLEGQTGVSRPIEDLFQMDDTNANSNFMPAEIDSTKFIAFITSSSGSTGLPKGIPLTHAALLNVLLCFTQQTAVWLVLETIYAISAIKSLLSATLSGSTRVVNFGPFSPERFFDVVEQCKVTTTATSVFVIKQLLKHPRIETADLSSIRFYTAYGSYISYDVIQKMKKYLKNGKLCNSFGMSETAGIIAFNINSQQNGCVGQLISGTVVKIVNDRGERLGVDEEGEICVKQRYPFTDYLGANENTSCFDSEGFFMTGDIGRFDENGDLFIIDRKGHMFKSAGCQVIPVELENFLDGIEGVKQSCVVPIPDSEHDFLPAAIIVKSEDSTCTEQSIFDAVSSKFASHKHLRGGIYFVESLPMTATLKIARRLVVQMAIELWKKQQK